MATLKDTAVILEAAATQLRTADAELTALRKQGLADEKEIARLRQELAPPVPTPTPLPAAGVYEGFGKNTTGGTGKPNYVVSNTNDSGPGSLPDALSKGDRNIVFTVAGTINLTKEARPAAPNVTIDCLTAPSPGITLRGACLSIRTGNVIVRGLRHRGSPVGIDGIAVYGARDVVLDRCSVSGFGDGAIDITENSANVLMLLCILGPGNPSHNLMSLIKYGAKNIGVYLNLFTGGEGRCPYVGRSDDAGETLAPFLVADVRNNLIHGYKHRGSEVRRFGTANIVNNYYDSPTGNPLLVSEGGSAYASGNLTKTGTVKGNRSTPYPVESPFPMVDAKTAALAVLAQAGARGPNFGLDSTDLAFIKQILLT